jgi:hypothetical protein
MDIHTQNAFACSTCMCANLNLYAYAYMYTIDPKKMVKVEKM